ncbi:MAG: CDP-paratose 2-epimerase [candidate division Zixibacteria bacterium]|nr:CDP-paratose 2-epimerase [candidate division Zixibacteria bacterium]
MYELKREQLVDKPAEDLFTFFSKAENLSKITPSGMGFQMLTPLPVEMKEGTVLDYVVHIAGFPVRWTTLITHCKPPNKFVDIQLKGPYSYWHHTHSFISTDGGTLVIDEVRYAIPLGIMGRIVHGLFVKRQLKKIFDYRSEAIKRIFS